LLLLIDAEIVLNSSLSTAAVKWLELDVANYKLSGQIGDYVIAN